MNMTATTSQGQPEAPSPRLYSEDIAPVKREGRLWTAYNIFTLWANDVHSLGNYTFAIGLFALGLGAWQILLTLTLGAIVLFLLLTMSSFLGEETGLTFPVVSRIAFGIRGGRIPAVCRGSVAIAWFGIQTYLAANVLSVLIVRVVPSLAPMLDQYLLGLSHMDWYSFGIMWVVQVFIASHGLETVRKYVAYAGPIILATFIGIAGWLFINAGFRISMSTDNPLVGGEMWRMIFGGTIMWVVIYGTFALNVCDFTRGCVSKKAIVQGNFTGILLNTILFAVLVVVMSGAQYRINGVIITSPADIVASISSTFWMFAAGLALIVLTIAVNLLANFVAPNYMLVDLLPKVLNFRRASFVTAFVGAIILPWRLYNSPVAITYFLGGLGAILGPIFGLIMVDYFVVRRRCVNIPQLYSESPTGTYFYQNGFNKRAFAVLVPVAAVAMVLALVPAFEPVSHFSWIIGAGLAGLLYWAVSPKKQSFVKVDGEAIARAIF